jgi:hypothetical protein
MERAHPHKDETWAISSATDWGRSLSWELARPYDTRRARINAARRRRPSRKLSAGDIRSIHGQFGEDYAGSRKVCGVR